LQSAKSIACICWPATLPASICTATTRASLPHRSHGAGVMARRRGPAQPCRGSVSPTSARWPIRDLGAPTRWPTAPCQRLPPA
jgi:hypothetical protein